jgi:hypothetical protein
MVLWERFIPLQPGGRENTRTPFGAALEDPLAVVFSGPGFWDHPRTVGATYGTLRWES